MLRKLARTLPKAQQRAVGERLGREADTLAQMMRGYVADDRDLAHSVEVKTTSNGLVHKVGPGAKTKRAKQLAAWRAAWRERGTRPGVRRYTNKSGTVVEMNHPGVSPRPFIAPAIRRRTKPIIAAAAQTVKEVNAAVVIQERRKAGKR